MGIFRSHIIEVYLLDLYDKFYHKVERKLIVKWIYFVILSRSKSYL